MGSLRCLILAGVFMRPVVAGSMCEPLDYLPPEIVDPKSCDKPYDEKVDVGSLEALMYEFLVG